MGIILREEFPFVHVVAAKFCNLICANCMKVADFGVLRRCSACGFCHYCDQQCQRTDWSSHKHECRILVKSSFGPVIEQLSRLLLRIIAKNRRPQPPAFNGRTFESLVSNSEVLGNRLHVQQTFLAVVEALKRSVGGGTVSSKEELFELYCKVATNAITITNDEEIGIGVGIYLGITELNHSCDPDAYFVFKGPKIILRALKDNVEEYSSKLRIAYCDLMNFTEVRRNYLEEHYCFVCDCSVCNDEKRDSIARSIICPNCRESYCPLNLDGTVSSCSKCRVIPVENSSRILDLLDEIQEFVDSFEARTVDSIEPALALYNKSERQLSSLNIPLCHLANGIARWALDHSNFALAAEFTEKTLECVRYFYPATYPIVSERFFSAGKLFSLEDATLDRAAQYLCQAISMLRKSHGEGHALVNEAIDLHRKVCFQQRALLGLQI